MLTVLPICLSIRIYLQFGCSLQALRSSSVIVRLDVYTCGHPELAMRNPGQAQQCSPSTRWNLTSIFGRLPPEQNYASLQSHGESYHPWLGGGRKCALLHTAVFCELVVQPHSFVCPSFVDACRGRSHALSILRTARIQTIYRIWMCEAVQESRTLSRQRRESEAQSSWQRDVLLRVSPSVASRLGRRFRVLPPTLPAKEYSDCAHLMR
jgi:hypothetical protein